MFGIIRLVLIGPHFRFSFENKANEQHGTLMDKYELMATRHDYAKWIFYVPKIYSTPQKHS